MAGSAAGKCRAWGTVPACGAGAAQAATWGLWFYDPSLSYFFSCRGAGLGGRLVSVVGVKARITCQAPWQPGEEKLVLARRGREGAVSPAGRGEAGAVLVLQSAGAECCACASAGKPLLAWGWHLHFGQLCDLRFGFVRDQLSSRSCAQTPVLCTTVHVVPVQGFSFASSALLVWVAREASPLQSPNMGVQRLCLRCLGCNVDGCLA